MTVFEDLIEELKEENLLEDAFFDKQFADVECENEPKNDSETSASETNLDGCEALTTPLADPVDEEVLETDLPQIEKPADERDFFRKRAMDEVSSLQMVEHVLSGVEREHMKMSPVSYDDLEAKKALHKFLQVSGDVKSPEHAEAEYALRNETESWSFALFERDQKISVANIRRFCEDSRPVLSSQALISLARFYRNSPYSEEVRGKFDFVMTRLFSRDTEEGTRRLLFPYTDMIGHISTLYENWSSISLYSREEDQIEISFLVTRLNEFSSDVENAETFDELLEENFFNKARLFKEGADEMFFVPEVVAAAIACNISIGNKYLELIRRERANHGPHAIEEKYGLTYDQIVSNAAGKTLLLADLLQMEPNADEFMESVPALLPEPKPADVKKPKAKSERRFDLFGINKWLIVIGVVCIAVSGGFYLWADKSVAMDSSIAVAKPVKVEDAEVKKHLRSLRSSSEILYAVTQPSYELLNETEQKEFLQRLLKLANDRNLRKVNLLNSKGRTVAYASEDQLELISQ